MSQVTFTTHRHMFRNYANTFSSEDAIVKLGSLKFSSTVSTRSANPTTSLKMERDMAKALLQQFLWTRLIENAVEPENRTYRDKGIWRLRSKGLCVLQDYCIKTNTIELLVQFKNYVDLSSTEPMFLIHVERLVENDRMNCKRKYISSLFAIMVASLPIRNDCNKTDSNSLNNNTFKINNSRQSMTSHTSHTSYNSKNLDNYHNINSNRKMSYHSDLYSTFSEKNSLSRHASIRSSDSGSTGSSNSFNYGTSIHTTTPTREAASITDYFPHIKILPNDLLVHANPPQNSGVNSSFQQQKALLQNLNPSSSNKFKMRTIFTSLLCCNWLVGYCTVASNDEAESIMTEFLNLGWITFYDEKHRNSDQVESSKSVALRLTGTGMKVVIDISVEQYSDFQQLQQLEQRQQQQQRQMDQSIATCSLEDMEKRYSIASSSSSHHTDSTFSSSILANFDEMSIASRSPLLSLKYKSSFRSSNPPTPIYNTPHQQNYHHAQQQKMYDSSSANYFDMDPSTLIISPLYENENVQHFNESLSASAYSNHTLPLTTSITLSDTSSEINNNNNSNKKSNGKETNAIKLKAILKDAQLRSLFREFLDYNLCAENLDFWIDHQTLRSNCQISSNSSSSEGLAMMPITKYQQLLQEAYLLWDTYLCPDASRELNIDHTLREDMTEEISQMATLINTGSGTESRMTVIISTDSTYDSLLAILNWFDRVNDQICRLMAADSVPKFIRTTEYKIAVNNSNTFRQHEQHEEEEAKSEEEEEQLQHQFQQPMQQQQQILTTIVTNSDIDEFPPPPQRKLKETIFL